MDWLLASLTPLASLGFAQDRFHISAGGGPPSYDTRGEGFELTLANLFSLRRGHYEDRTGDIDGNTWGWSAGRGSQAWAGCATTGPNSPRLGV